MRNYEEEFKSRVGFIKDLLKKTGAKGVILGNSGGKDCALVGILARAACEKVVGVIMPCLSRRNYEEDLRDGKEVADKFGIETRIVDITPVREQMVNALSGKTEFTDLALANINPRIRMTTLYTIAASENLLVAGTGNRSERYMGYFTKWGDGGCDFNPISDLTVREVYEFLEYLDAPMAVRTKAPSAALFEGQTDEQEMGITYKAIDDYLLFGTATKEDKEKIESAHARTEHKRVMPTVYKNQD